MGKAKNSAIMGTGNFRMLLRNLRKMDEQKKKKEALDLGSVSNSADNEPWIESEDCECKHEMEAQGIEYTHDFTWEGDVWVCDHCEQPQ
jgi:hypothetical protein